MIADLFIGQYLFDATHTACVDVLKRYFDEYRIKDDSFTFGSGSIKGINAAEYEYKQVNPLGTPDKVFGKVQIFQKFVSIQRPVVVFFYVSSEDRRDFMDELVTRFVTTFLQVDEENLQPMVPWEEISDKGNDRLIVQMLLQGDSVVEIARRLGFAAHTISNHLSRIRKENSNLNLYSKKQSWRKKGNPGN